MALRANHGRELLAPIASFLLGDWSLLRRIRDTKTGELGRLRGTARFSPQGDALLFIETGLLNLPHGQMAARQSYRFVIEGTDAFSVFFADGRFFHRADIACGIAPVAHDCAPDSYRGRYRILGPDRWSLSWRVTGPRKNLFIGSIFSRARAG